VTTPAHDPAHDPESGSVSEPVSEPGAGPARPSRRRTFGPVVLVGLASSGLAVLASTRPWVSVEGGAGQVAGIGPAGMATTTDIGESPLAAALSLVLLATWGVVLVTRGWFRRVLAGLGAVTALGLVAVVVTGAVSLPDSVAEEVAVPGADTPDPTYTVWLLVAGVAAVLAVAACVAAVRLAPSWPEMGTRYDAPTGDATPAPQGPATSLDLWRSIDDGDDPTR